MRYLTELISSQSKDQYQPTQANIADQQNAFLNYTRMLTLYAEGKYFSGRADIASMAKKMAAVEKDMAHRAQNEAEHWELYDMWKMIEMLDGAIPKSKRPN